MEVNLENKVSNEVLDENISIEKRQNNFLETTIGKVVNGALDVGLRLILPDMIENQVIEIKNTLLSEGLKEGISQAVQSAMDFGKSALGIVTGKFDNISQVEMAVEKGGIIDGISSTIDFTVNKTTEKGILNRNVGNMIKQGKNVLLDNISKNIESMLTNQIKSIEKVGEYLNNWKQYYQAKNFEGMEKEYTKLEKEMKKLVPLENTIKEVRQVENLHQFIKNNGKSFDLSDTELKLAQRLVQ